MDWSSSARRLLSLVSHYSRRLAEVPFAHVLTQYCIRTVLYGVIYIEHFAVIKLP